MSVVDVNRTTWNKLSVLQHFECRPVGHWVLSDGSAKVMRFLLND